jgi:hypothetical protein
MTDYSASESLALFAERVAGLTISDVMTVADDLLAKATLTLVVVLEYIAWLVGGCVEVGYK